MLINFAINQRAEFTTIEFPRMVQDREYLFKKLSLIPEVTREKFDVAFDRLVDLDKVHF
jgi:hypothetical protein